MGIGIAENFLWRELTVYCSGPLFSSEERAAMSEIAREVEAHDVRTFLALVEQILNIMAEE